MVLTSEWFWFGRRNGMLNYVQLLQPKTVEEAVGILKKNKMAIVLAGGCWTRMSKRTFPAAVDISGLNLRYINETDDYFAIGAMATQWDVERYEPFKQFAKGLVVKAVQPILGVQFRNTATMGGSVAAKFGFSDIIPTLLALNSSVVLAAAGEMSLIDYMNYKERDLLLEIRIPKDSSEIAVRTLRKSASDFPYLTGAMSLRNGECKVFIGCRPAQPILAKQTSSILTTKGVAGLKEALVALVDEVKIQTNSHASMEYRQAMAKLIVQEMVGEVLA